MTRPRADGKNATAKSYGAPSTQSVGRDSLPGIGERCLSASDGSRWQFHAAWAVTFLVAFIGYVLTVAPGLSGQDSGELVSSAYLLGIAHPPGYPLWCMIGKAFSFLPFGNVAYRINLVSCFFGAATAAATAAVTYMLARNLAAAVCAGLCLAFSQLFWSISVVAQTKTLNTFFVMLIVLLLFEWDRRRSDRLLYAAAFAYGLSCTNHPTAWPLGAFFGGYVLWRDWRLPLRRFRLVLFCGLLVLLGLTVYLYLPIRSAANTYMNWGNPRTFHDALFHIMRKQYPGPGTESPRSLALFVRQAGRLVDFMLHQFTPLLACFVVVGFVELVKQRNWGRTGLLSCIFGATSLGFVVLTNFKIEFQDIFVNSIFFITAMPIAAILLGLGVSRFLAAGADALVSLGVRLPKNSLEWTAVLAVPLLPFLAFFNENDYSRYYYAYDYAVNLLETMDLNAIYFPSGDHSSFTVMYLQAVEGRRPDVAVADKYGYVEPSLFAPVAKKFARFPDKAQRAEIERWIIEHTDRPVYFTTKRDMGDLPGYRIAPTGILFRVFRPKEEVNLHPEIWNDYHWRNLEGDYCARDYTANVILSDFHYFKGLFNLERGRIDPAMEEFRQVIASAQDMKEVYNNLGSSCAEKGLLRLAAYFYERAIEISPSYLTAHRNLAFICKDLGDAAGAIRHFRAASELAPYNLTYPMELAVLLESAGDYDEAIRIFERLAGKDPTNYFFFRRLGFLYKDQRKDRAAAARNFRKALELNADQPDVSASLKDPDR